MIVHELRSPANQIKHKVSQAIDQLKIIRIKQERSQIENEKIIQMIEEIVYGSSFLQQKSSILQSIPRQNSQLDVIMEEDKNVDSPLVEKIPKIKSLF
tara:strand:- start:816 stop:1109 length:294 start_codon:yes stop_codon:yes gene_type:complete